MKKHILIVDDNKSNLLIVRQILGELYDVTPVVTGNQALECLKRKKIDLVILDIYMPEMSGKEVFLAMKENASTASIPVIFTSAETNRNRIAEYLGLGEVDYIMKPFDIENLITRVNTALAALN